jgi:putative transcriptional regulator
LAHSPGELRIYAGYAGWAPGQLAFELAHGGWRMIEGRKENVFSEHPERLWRRLTEALSGISI